MTSAPALYEDSLKALARLLNKVSASNWEAHIRSDIEAWETRRDSAQHRSKYGGHSTYSDWAIHADNGHRVDETQQVWANALLSRLQLLLRQLAERPEDPSVERKLLDGLTRHRSFLTQPTDSPASGTGEAESGANLRAIHCQACGYVHASESGAERVIADDVLGVYLRRAYESGTMIELVDALLDGTDDNLETYRTRIRLAAGHAGIAIRKTFGRRDACAACGSDDVAIVHWSLRDSGNDDDRPAFEPAEFERHKLPVESPPPNKTGKSDNTVPVRLWGIVIVLLAFAVLVAELRYFGLRGTPEATGSVRGSWGTLVLMGLPLVVLVGGVLQTISGVFIRDYFSVFPGQSTWTKLINSFAAIASAILALSLATAAQQFL